MSTFCRFLVIVVGFLYFSCDGDQAPRARTGDRLADSLLNVPQTELVNFNLAGTAACSRCGGETINSLIVEVFPEEVAFEPAASGIFKGLGPFHFSKIRYRKGAKVTVRGKLHIGSADRGTILEAATEVNASEEDDGIVSVTLNF